jgi:hypothetical protein
MKRLNRILKFNSYDENKSHYEKNIHIKIESSEELRKKNIMNNFLNVKKIFIHNYKEMKKKTFYHFMCKECVTFFPSKNDEKKKLKKVNFFIS